jgi:hypothetical protein
VDVYQLILDRGTIGALLYANEIENKNIRLASKIDKAVNYINRISQVPTFSPVEVPSMPAQIPSQVPKEHTMGPGTKQILDSRVDPPGNKNVDFFGRLTQEGSGMYAASKFLKYIKLPRVGGVDQLINLAKTGTAEEQIAAKQALTKLINKAPNEIELGGLFGTDLANAKGLLTKKDLITKISNGLPADSAEILANAAHSPNINFVSKATSALKSKISKAPVESPLLESLDLSKAAKNVIKDANPTEWENMLASHTATDLIADVAKVQKGLSSKNLTTLLTEGDGAAAGAQNVLKAVAETEGPFSGIFGKILGFAKNPLFGKFLMGVGTALQAYDVWKDIQQYGYDAQTICKIAGVISGVCSFIPPLAPFAIPLNFVLGFGCSFVPRDSSKASDQISSKDITDRAQNINASNLDSNDLSKLQTIANEASDDVDFQNSISQALKNKSFKNLLDVAALAYKYLHEDKSAIPGVNKQTPQSNTDSKPATVSFNYRKYRLAFG